MNEMNKWTFSWTDENNNLYKFTILLDHATNNHYRFRNNGAFTEILEIKIFVTKLPIFLIDASLSKREI